MLAPPSPLKLIGDFSRLRQVLINLLANAIKFTDVGFVRLVIRFSCQLEITVTDSGIGIPPAQQAAVFEPFVQADSSDARRHGGVGLGLAIVRSLVFDSMKGSIRLESTPGFGSQFLVNLPFRRAQTPPTGSPNSLPLPASKSSSWLKTPPTLLSLPATSSISAENSFRSQTPSRPNKPRPSAAAGGLPLTPPYR